MICNNGRNNYNNRISSVKLVAAAIYIAYVACLILNTFGHFDGRPLHLSLLIVMCIYIYIDM